MAITSEELRAIYFAVQAEMTRFNISQDILALFKAEIGNHGILLTATCGKAQVKHILSYGYDFGDIDFIKSSLKAMSRELGARL